MSYEFFKYNGTQIPFYTQCNPLNRLKHSIKSTNEVLSIEDVLYKCSSNTVKVGEDFLNRRGVAPASCP